METNILYNLTLIVADLGVLFFLSRKQTVWTLIACLGLLSFIGFFLALFLGENWFGIARLLAYGLFIHGVIMLDGLAILMRQRFKKLAIVSAVLGLIVAAIGVDAFAIEPYWLEISRVQITTSKLQKPLKIVVLADFQTDVWGEYERKALRATMQEKADLILLPGDYLQEYKENRREILRKQVNSFLQKINFNAKLGVYAVRGDVDRYTKWLQIFDGLPVTVFQNTKTVVLPEICITGLTLEDSRNFQLKIPKCDNKFHIAFGHAPDFALADVRADLLVAGHTHGGQVRLPFIGPLVTFSRVPRKWAAGVTKLKGDRTLIVSRGVGMERGYAPRIRFLCRPQLVVVDLRPG